MSNILKALTPRYPEHVAKVREITKTDPLLSRFSLSDIECELLWEQFSRDFGGSFLIIHDETVANFKQWLTE